MLDSLKSKVFVAAAVLSPALMFAEDVTLPAVGQAELSSYITAGITALAGVVGVAVGGYCAFALIRKGLRWLRTALG